jgi:hypothetical protein
VDFYQEVYKDGDSICTCINLWGYKLNLVNLKCKVEWDKYTNNQFIETINYSGNPEFMYIENLFLNLNTNEIEYFD